MLTNFSVRGGEGGGSCLMLRLNFNIATLLMTELIIHAKHKNWCKLCLLLKYFRIWNRLVWNCLLHLFCFSFVSFLFRTSPLLSHPTLCSWFSLKSRLMMQLSASLLPNRLKMLSMGNFSLWSEQLVAREAAIKAIFKMKWSHYFQFCSLITALMTDMLTCSCDGC